MLYSIKKVFDNGDVTNEIVSTPPPLSINPKDITSSFVEVFKYEVEYHIPPIIFSASDGKKYLMPMNIECHPDTTQSDILYIKPKQKKTIQKVEGSTGSIYKTIYDPNKKTYKCNCMGFFRARAKGGVCKHVKALMEQNK